MTEETKKVSLDLAALDTTDKAEAGEWMHLEGPNGEDLFVNDEPVRILLMGADSKEYLRLQHRQTTKRVNEMTKGGKRKNNRWSEDMYEGNIDLLVKATKGWENVVYEGKSLEPTAPSIRMIYERLNWVREQAWDFINDRSNYLGN